MNKLKVILVLASAMTALLGALSISQSAIAEPVLSVTREESKDGLLLRTAFVDGIAQPFAFATVTVPPGSFLFRLDYPTEPKSIAAYSKQKSIRLAASVGWLDSYTPLAVAGMLSVDGKSYSALKLGDANLDALVCANREGDVSLPRNFSQLFGPETPEDQIEKFVEQKTRKFQGCIQAGPSLIWNDDLGRKGIFLIDNDTHDAALEELFGRDVGFARRNFPRSFLGRDREDNIVLGITQPIDLETLADVLANRLDTKSRLSRALLLAPGERSDIAVDGKPLFGSLSIRGYPVALLVKRR